MTVPDDISQIHRLDQADAAATELARTIAAQYRIYRDAGMSKAAADSLCELFLENCLADPVCECTPEEPA